MKVTCIVIDDEPPAIKILEKYIAKTPQLVLTATATNPMEGLQKLQQQPVELLFLDINMPGLSGISLFRSLANPPLLVFTTAYPEYAVEGFELEALDFLVKPFSFERFLKAANKAIEYLDNQKKLQSQEKKGPMEHLIVRADRRIYRVPVDEILYLQAYGDYVRIFTDENSYMPKETLSSIEKRLSGETFIRIHRSYIVALKAVRYLEGNHVAVCEEKIPVGQTFRENLLNRLGRKE